MFIPINGAYYLRLIDVPPKTIRRLKETDTQLKDRRFSTYLGIVFGAVVFAIGASLWLFGLRGFESWAMTASAAAASFGLSLVIGNTISYFRNLRKIRYRSYLQMGYDRRFFVGPRHWSYRVLFGDAHGSVEVVSDIINNDLLVNKIRSVLGHPSLVEDDWTIMDPGRAQHLIYGKLVARLRVIDLLREELGSTSIVDHQRLARFEQEAYDAWNGETAELREGLEAGDRLIASRRVIAG